HTHDLMAGTDDHAAGLLDRDLADIKSASEAGFAIPSSAPITGRRERLGSDDYLSLLPESATRLVTGPDSVPTHPPSQAPRRESQPQSQTQFPGEQLQ